MSVNNIKEIGRLKRMFAFIAGKRRTIMLSGYSGSGKTTILTVLGLNRDVTDKDVKRRTTAMKRVHIEYKTKEGEKLYIKSVDMDGSDKTVNDKAFEKELLRHRYILYLLDVNGFVNGNKKEANEYSLSWLQRINDLARENKKVMMLILSHADEYLKSIGEEYSEGNKAIIRDLFLSDSGLLSGVKYNCEVMVADVQKIKEVKSIIDHLIQLDRLT